MIEPAFMEQPRHGSRRRRAALALLAGAIGSLLAAPIASAGVSTAYVAAGGNDQAGANTCASAADPCGSLTHALSETSSGATIYVAGTLDIYDAASDPGDASGVDVSQDVTIAQDPSGATAVIQGPGVNVVSPSSLLTVSGADTVSLRGLTFQDGNADQTQGGAVSNNAGGDLTVTASTFRNNGSGQRFESMSGGAIDNGDNGGSGTLTVVDSTFTGNQSGADAGAIDNADNSGSGEVTIEGSTFTNNTDTHNNGGAIVNGDNFGTGIMTISDSTFTDNVDTIGNGGAIDNGNNGGEGTLTVDGSTFTGNSGLRGGAIDQGNDGQLTPVVHGFGQATLTVNDSTFTDNIASAYDGGAINSADDTGTATASVAGSSFTGNRANLGDGGAIDSADHGGSGTLTVSSSSFIDNSSAGQNGGAIDNGDRSGTGALTISGSTFSGNLATARDGGAIDNGDLGGDGTATITDSTFSGNGAVSGGAIGNGASWGGEGTLTMVADSFAGDALATTAGSGPEILSGNGATGAGSGTVFSAGNLFAGACVGSSTSWTDGGYNAAEDASCLSSAAPATDALSTSVATALSPLTVNGGGTATILIHADSPAFELIPEGTTVTLDGKRYSLCDTTDQRGVTNPAGQPCNAGATQLAVPVISASLTSSGQKSAAGWWDAPVTISFHCISAVALTTGCPPPVTLAANAADQSVSRTITGTDGVGSGSVAVTDIDIDQSPPAVSVSGPVNGRTYRSLPPAPKCVATAGVSGLASCTLAKTVSATSTGYRETLSGTATSNAALSATSTISFSVDERPTVSIHGPRAGATYGRLPPRARCIAKAAASPVQSCALAKSTIRTRVGYRERITATATSEAGITATATLRFIVDQRVFAIKINGPTSGATYVRVAPALACAAVPDSMRVKSCTVRVHRTRLSIGFLETATALAKSSSGQRARATATFIVQTTTIPSFAHRPPVVGQAYVLPFGRSYEIVVASAQRPLYVYASPAPMQPSGGYVPFERDGTFMGLPRWKFVVDLPSALRAFPAWNLGVRIGGQLDVINVRPQGKHSP